MGITWTGGLSSDRPGMEKGPRSGPMERSGSSGPLPEEVKDLPRGQGLGLATSVGWGHRGCPPKLLS